MLDAPIAPPRIGGIGAIPREIDPRVRIAAAAAFAVLTVSLSDFAALGAALALSLTMMTLARLPAATTLRRMVAMDGFIVFLLVMLPFTMPGETMVTVFGFAASWEGFHRAVAIALKANAIVLMLMALVGTLPSATLCHALFRLRAPEALVHLMMFTVRYIDVLRDEYDRLRTAMKTRGFRPRNSRHTYVSIGYLVGMLLVRSLERSERILEAMKCRGFSGRFHVIDDMRAGPRDAWFAGLLIAAAIGLITLERAGVATY